TGANVCPGTGGVGVPLCWRVTAISAATSGRTRVSAARSRPRMWTTSAQETITRCAISSHCAAGTTLRRQRRRRQLLGPVGLGFRERGLLVNIRGRCDGARGGWWLVVRVLVCAYAACCRCA